MAEKQFETRWWISFIVQIIIYVVAIMTAYGTLDKRLTTVEIKQEAKVDGERLEKQLKEWKKEIIDEMKIELQDFKQNK